MQVPCEMGPGLILIKHVSIQIAQEPGDTMLSVGAEFEFGK